MVDKIKDIRDVILNVFIIMLFIYLFIMTYIYLQTNITYNLYIIKVNIQVVLVILGIMLILLYLPKVKTVTYDLFKKFHSQIKSFSLGQKFVLIAIILLIYSAISLIKNNENYANAIAILSYYFLTLGVINEFIIYVLEEKINDKINIIQTFASLLFLGLAVHYTSDIKYYFKYLDIVIIAIALIYIIIELKNKKKRY
ncbi:hypothetical protein ACPB8Q_06565 [Methanocaldococcus indicus]|uniref:hypothetical protein n=1 Tax=Methanocaldococcus indicus TaxID=213231 RepID=UPI003C6CCED0